LTPKTSAIERSLQSLDLKDRRPGKRWLDLGASFFRRTVVQRSHDVLIEKMDRGGSKEIRLILRTRENGDLLTIGCREATAKAFGWLEYFETYEQRCSRLVREGRRVFKCKTYSARQAGIGRPIRIGCDDNRRYIIRTSSRVRVTDLAELAHFTRGPWLWMDRPDGRRWAREQWARHWDKVSLRAA